MDSTCRSEASRRRWGTSEVLDKTLQRIRDNQLSLCLLDPMSDVDRPEDLEVWYGAKKNPPG